MSLGEDSRRVICPPLSARARQTSMIKRGNIDLWMRIRSIEQDALTAASRGFREAYQGDSWSGNGCRNHARWARPPGVTHLHFTPPISERQRHKRRKAPRDERTAEFQHSLRAGLSRKFGRMGAVNGCCCATVIAAAVHKMLWFVFSMQLATWSKRTSTRASSNSGEFCSRHLAVTPKSNLWDSKSGTHVWNTARIAGKNSVPVENYSKGYSEKRRKPNK